MPEDNQKMQQVNHLIRLLKRGDAKSLTDLRNLLGIKSNDLAHQIGVSRQTLELWESDREQPPGLHYARWKIKLSSYIDERLSALLGIDGNEVKHKYWALVWDFIG